MNNENFLLQRKPLSSLEENSRPLKRHKSGVSMDVVAVLADIGASKFTGGHYQAAEECFSQALCRIDIDHLCSQVGLKVANSVDPAKTTKSEGFCCADENDGEKHASAMAQRSDIEYDEGMYVYDSLLQMQDTTPVDEAAAMLLHNIAQTHLKRRDYKTAITWFQKSLHRFNMLNGIESLNIVKNLHSLGYCLYRTRSEDQATKFYQRALEIVSELGLGAIHLAASANCVGVTLFNQQSCSTDIAMQMFRKSLTLYQACEKVGKASVATVLNNIGRVHYLRSEFKQAFIIYQECLKMRREVLGIMSIDVAATTYNLGQACYQLGRLDESLIHYKEFLKISIAAAGESSKDIALVYKGIGDIYQDKSDIKMALHYFNQALQVHRACAKGRPAADIAAMLNKMGNLCYEMKDFNTAMKHYQEGLLVEEKILAPNHPHIIITTTNMAHIFKQLGKYQKALSTYKQVLHMQQQQFGQNSFALAETMSSIGLMQYHLKQYEQAFESYQEALRIRRQHLGSDDHPEIASTLNSIGLVLFKQEIFDLAKNCFTESLRIRSKLFGKDHRDVAILWYNIATIHFENGEDELAIQMYKETLRVERHALGEDHPDVALTLQHLGQVHQQLGYNEEAIKYFQEALDIERKRKEPVKRSLARILNLLGNVYLQLARTSEMMPCYIEASRIYEANRVCGDTVVIGGYNFYGLSKTNPPCAPVA